VEAKRETKTANYKQAQAGLHRAGRVRWKKSACLQALSPAQSNNPAIERPPTSQSTAARERRSKRHDRCRPLHRDHYRCPMARPPGGLHESSLPALAASAMSLAPTEPAERRSRLSSAIAQRRAYKIALKVQRKSSSALLICRVWRGWPKTSVQARMHPFLEDEARPSHSSDEPWKPSIPGLQS